MKGLFTKVLAGLRGTTEVVQFVQARMSGDWCCVTTRVMLGQGDDGNGTQRESLGASQ